MNPADQIAGVVSDFLNPIVHSPVVQTSVRLAALALVVLWFVTALWAFRDAWSRTHNVVAVLVAPIVIVAATPLGFPLAVLVWRILRPQRTIAEAREQELTIDALRASTRVQRCFACGSKVDADWRRCPWCRTWLMAPCPRCERLVELSAAVCPWCITDLAPGSLVPAPGMPALVPVMSPAAMMPVMDPSLIRAVAPTAPVDLAATEPEPVAAAMSATQPAAVGLDDVTAVHRDWAPEPPAPVEPAEEPHRAPLWSPEPAAIVEEAARASASSESALPAAEPAVRAESAAPADAPARDALWGPEGANAVEPDVPAERPRPAPKNPLWGPVVETAAAEAAMAAPAEIGPSPAAPTERTPTAEPASLLGPSLPPAIPEAALAPSRSRRARHSRGRSGKPEPKQMPEEAASSTALW